MTMFSSRRGMFVPLALLGGALLCLLILLRPSPLTGQVQDDAEEAAMEESCANTGTSFPLDDFDAWANEYHRRVGEIVEPIFRQPVGTEEESDEEENPEDPAVTILRWHRLFLCALQQQETFLGPEAERAVAEDGEVNVGESVNEQIRRRRAITVEATIAERALGRTMLLTGGLRRFDPLTEKLREFQERSIAVRNAVSLAADTVSCLNTRLADAAGSLRDP